MLDDPSRDSVNRLQQEVLDLDRSTLPEEIHAHHVSPARHRVLRKRFVSLSHPSKHIGIHNQVFTGGNYDLACFAAILQLDLAAGFVLEGKPRFLVVATCQPRLVLYRENVHRVQPSQESWFIRLFRAYGLLTVPVFWSY